MRILRLGRTTLYQQTSLYIATNGAKGDIPAKKFGRQTRILRAQLEERLGASISWPIPAEVTPISDAPSNTTATTLQVRSATTPRHRPDGHPNAERT